MAPENRPPFPVDARVVEDDTWRVLGTDPEFRPAAEHPVRLMQALRNAQPLSPGSVALEAGDPPRLHAIVHDLDLDPTWREEWIAAALDEAFRIAGRNGFRALALPLLGTRRGRLSAHRFLRLLGRALSAPSAGPLRKLWLVFP